MHIDEFVSNFQNHPVLFVGTGFSLRYLQSSFTWDGLLKHVSLEFNDNAEYYLDLKAQNAVGGRFSYEAIASRIEADFTAALMAQRRGKFEKINDDFYDSMEREQPITRLKLYLAKELSRLDLKEDRREELAELKKAVKNIGSIITTNYDQLLEQVFEFAPLIGNDILLSNPYGSIYKIHGCVSQPGRIIITSEDYGNFDSKYELIRAQLLSLFIHNPIVFIGYSINDDNIKKILKTIFSYVEPNSEQATKIRNNFLLVEYSKGVDSQTIAEHDIELEGFSTIRINKIKTDNYAAVYKALSSLKLPVSAMDVRKVQNIVQELKAGGEIHVHITEDLDQLKNSDRIIAIGSQKSITYKYMNVAETISNYFKILDEENAQILLLINRFTINRQQFFPVFGFSIIQSDIHRVEQLKQQQKNKIKEAYDSTPDSCRRVHQGADTIFGDQEIAQSNKVKVLLWNVVNGNISLDALETYLKSSVDHKSTDYRKLLCVYDYARFGGVLKDFTK